MKQTPLSEVKDDLSKYIRMAEKEISLSPIMGNRLVC